LDGELSQRKREKFEKHLQVCESCAETLEEMKELEMLGSRAKLPRISEAYWESFPARVKNKLLLRERESPSQIFWKRIKPVFQVSPFRLKLAAGVASIIIVAWMGRIYMDYRPASIEKQLQSPSSITPGKSQALVDTTETVLPSAAADEDIVVSKKLIESEARQPVFSEPLSPSVPSENNAPVASDKVTVESAPGQLLPEIVRGEKPVIERGGTANLRRVSREKAAETQTPTIEPEPGLALQSVTPKGEQETIASPDTLSIMDSLRTLIQRHEEHILSQPNDIMLEKIFQDLAQNHLELCLLTKNKEYIKAAEKRIEEILRLYLYPATRISLNKTLEKLRALEKSLK
jgi:hypothetical protein